MRLKILLIKSAAADYILIGAGAGLSAATTLDYFDGREFANSYPNLAAKGIKTRWEALWTKFDTAEEHWAMWATHVLQIRYNAPAGEAYYNLLQLIKNKEYFIITTNVDGQFEKAGFDKGKIFAVQGDYAFFQCALPCCDELIYNEPVFRKMVSRMDVDNFKIRTEDIPRCPNCGGMIAMNLRSGKNFVEDIWMERSIEYGEFINKASHGGSFLMLEFGVGFNTPSIIRYPFEWYAGYYDNSFLIRFNKDYPNASDKVPSGKYLSISENIKIALEEILKVRS